MRSDAGADGDGGGGSGGGSRAAQFLRVLLDYVANDGCNLLLAAAAVGAQAVSLPLLRRAGGNPPLLSGNLGCVVCSLLPLLALQGVLRVRLPASAAPSAATSVPAVTTFGGVQIGCKGIQTRT